MSASQFAQETVRKEKLLTLLEKHEKTVKFKFRDKKLKFGPYDRIFNGSAEVSKLGKSNLRLKREDGRSLGVLQLSPEIVELAKIGDFLMATLGHRFGHWHLIQVQMIGSSLQNQNGENQIHLSVSPQALSFKEGQRENI